MPPLSLTTAFLLRGFIIGGVLDFANSVDLLMDHGFCDPCFRFFNDLHEEGAPQRLMELRLFNSQCYVWIHSVYSVNPMKLQESCFISRDQQWPDAYDAGMESKTAMIWPPSSSPAFQAPSGRDGLFQGWERIEESARRKEAVQSGSLPLVPDWLISGLAMRIGIICMRRLLLTGPYDGQHMQYGE